MKYMDCMWKYNNNSEKSFRWQGKEIYVGNLAGKEKKIKYKENYQATRAWLKSEGVNLYLAAQPYLLVFSGHML